MSIHSFTPKKRRKDDDCIMRSLYLAATPYIQVCGFIIMCSFIAGGIWFNFNAYGADISSLKTWRMKQEEHNAIEDTHNARIEQSLQDIHDFLLPRGSK